MNRHSKQIANKYYMWYYMNEGEKRLSQFEKLLQRIRNNPKTVKFDEIKKVLLKYGYVCTQPKEGSSHYTFRKGENLLTVPKHGAYVKEIYVRQVIDALDEE